MTRRDAVDVAADAPTSDGNLVRMLRERSVITENNIIHNMLVLAAERIESHAEALRSASNSGAEALAEADALVANYIEHDDVLDEEEDAYCRAVDRHYARSDGEPLPAPGAPASPWRPIVELGSVSSRHVVFGWWQDGEWAVDFDTPEAPGAATHFIPADLPTPPASKDT